MAKLHFIVGIWRSGTTLLREVLGMSEVVKIFPEHFVLLNHIDMAENFESIKEEMLNSIMNNPDFVHFAKPNLKKLKTEFLQTSNFEEAINVTYNACLKDGENATLLLDKNPIYSYFLAQLLKLFPEAKFIWMLREPKDNCISRSKHDIQTIKSYSYLATWWNLTNELIANEAKKNPDRFLLVPYDLMVQSPEPWVKKITSFLEIDYNPKMLAFEKKKEERITDFVLAAKARDGEITEEYANKKKAMWENLQKPINTSKTKQWKLDLSIQEIKDVDTISLEYYNSLLAGDFSAKPNYKGIYKMLAKLSLAKLNWDIKRKRLS